VTYSKNYYVYILASKKRVLYIGMTNDLVKRMWQHKQHQIPGFTARYNVDRLVYFEHTEDALSAIGREKQLKGWLRQRKIELIESANSQWNDLYNQIV
jgi:putative endonuclease